MFAQEGVPFCPPCYSRRNPVLKAKKIPETAWSARRSHGPYWLPEMTDAADIQLSMEALLESEGVDTPLEV